MLSSLFHDSDYNWLQACIALTLLRVYLEYDCSLTCRVLPWSDSEGFREGYRNLISRAMRLLTPNGDEGAGLDAQNSESVT
jgi:hypothetical protein